MQTAGILLVFNNFNYLACWLLWRKVDCLILQQDALLKNISNKICECSQFISLSGPNEATAQGRGKQCNCFKHIGDMTMMMVRWLLEFFSKDEEGSVAINVIAGLSGAGPPALIYFSYLPIPHFCRLITSQLYN